jgi:drug/metabolite transporter (DMT)-like permease
VRAFTLGAMLLDDYPEGNVSGNAVKSDRYIRPVSRRQNRITIAFIVISNSIGNLLLAIGTKQLPAFDPGAMLPYTSMALVNGWIIAGVALLALWMYAQLTMLTWSDLSYVIPVTASGYILTAILGVLVLNEGVSLTRWFGIGLISLGVLLVSETAPKTSHKRTSHEVNGGSS